MKKIFPAIIFAALTCFSLKMVASDSPQESPIAAQQAELKKQQEGLVHLKQAAAKTNNPEIKAFTAATEAYINAMANCVNDPQNSQEEVKASMCIILEASKLAEVGNPLAQHFMANTYDDMGDFDKSLKWFQTTLDNPKTPNFYKPEVKADMEKAAKDQALKNKTNTQSEKTK